MMKRFKKVVYIYYKYNFKGPIVTINLDVINPKRPLFFCPENVVFYVCCIY